MRRLLVSFRRTVVGAIAEHSGTGTWTPEAYERLIQLKNVDFWRCLYTGIDARRASPLYPFLERYYAIAQKLNDVQDFADDERRGQPNFVSLHLRRRSDADTGAVVAPPLPAPNALVAPVTPESFPPAVEEHLAAELAVLVAIARELPALERDIALLKLGEMLDGAFRMGLFAGATKPAPAPAVEAPLQLYWHSDLRDVVHAFGPNALEEVPCAVCGSEKRKRLFEKQGFTYHRCADCTHVYVNPEVRLDVQMQLGRALDHETDGDQFLDVQSIFAQPICHLLRLRTRGPRLLDLGFGRGNVMRLARAYGFETYGLDSSGALTAELEPEFGWRVCRATLGVDPVPWPSFDVIVMSHVAEHLAVPSQVLGEVFNKLNPGGFLYIAVPDVGLAPVPPVRQELGRHEPARAPPIFQPGVARAPARPLRLREFGAHSTPDAAADADAALDAPHARAGRRRIGRAGDAGAASDEEGAAAGRARVERPLMLVADWPPHLWSGIGAAVARQSRALGELGLGVNVLVGGPRSAGPLESIPKVRVQALEDDRFPLRAREFDGVHLHSLALAELALEFQAPLRRAAGLHRPRPPAPGAGAVAHRRFCRGRAAARAGRVRSRDLSQRVGSRRRAGARSDAGGTRARDPQRAAARRAAGAGAR